MIVRGAAGTGKTTMMSEAVEAIERNDKAVVTVAPSAGASRGQLRKEGFGGADTLAMFLADPSMQEQARGNVLWVDEAGLVGTRTMRRLFELSDQLDCRVVLCGDRHQHGPVERGDALRLLESDAGLVPAQLSEVHRQEGKYRQAVEYLGKGQIAEGFGVLDRLGWIREVANDQRYRALADEYVAAVVNGRTTLVISPTHAEAERTSQEIRVGLRQAGLLGHDERPVDVLVPLNLTVAERAEARHYRASDVLRFHQNAAGHRKGSQLTVEEGRPLPLDQAERFTVYGRRRLALAPGDRVRVTANGRTKDGTHPLHNGDLHTLAGFTKDGDLELANGWTVARDFGHLARGFVQTSYSAQGKGVDKVIAAISSESARATSAQQFYVSASRGKRELSVYTDDKKALREAVQRDEDRTTATEFVAGEKHRARALQLQRAAIDALGPVPKAGRTRLSLERHRPIERET